MKPRQIARDQITKLKNGALLVRLFTKSNSINALRQRNQNELADQIQARQEDLNRRIVNSFLNNFDFCPAYFFYSDYTQFVKQNQIDSVIFLNNLQPDSSIRPIFQSYLTAEFGRVEQDTGKYRDNEYYYYKDENGLQRKSVYYAGPVFGFDALVVKSDQFVQLNFGHFPYYVKTWGGIRGSNKAVATLNKKLHRFYKRQVK